MLTGRRPAKEDQFGRDTDVLARASHLNGDGHVGPLPRSLCSSPDCTKFSSAIDEGVRVEKDRLATHQVEEGHTFSSFSASSRSKVSASPFQPIIPAVCAARLWRLCTVTDTVSF